MFFVNLNLRHVKNDPQVLDNFLARGVHPELGLDPVLMDKVNLDWHRAMADRLEQAGLACALHLPFFDLQPGSADALILKAGRDRLRLALQVAKVYKPKHMIGHAKYDHLLYMHTYDLWKKRAVGTWLHALETWADHPPLYLENTFEPDPATLARLVHELAEDHGANVGLCLDVGHWHSFAGGMGADNLDAWLGVFAHKLMHLHLHDNDGTFDHHVGLGHGLIPWGRFFEGLLERGLRPGVTFEPHGEEAFVQTMRFVADNPQWFDALGVKHGAGPA